MLQWPDPGQGLSAASSSSSTTADFSFTPAEARSRHWHGWSATPPLTGPSCGVTNNVLYSDIDATDGISFGFGYYTGAVTANSAVTLQDAPGSDTAYEYLAAEFLAAGTPAGTFSLDPSTPALADATGATLQRGHGVVQPAARVGPGRSRGGRQLQHRRRRLDHHHQFRGADLDDAGQHGGYHVGAAEGDRHGGCCRRLGTPPGPGPAWRRRFQPWRRAVQQQGAAAAVRVVLTYYVSPSGSDSSSGTSTSAPWQTVAKVNSTLLYPGDTVLFQGGQTFSGTMLQPGQGGTAAQPDHVRLVRHRPGDHHQLSSSTAIYVYESGGVTVENLIITGPGAATAGAGGYVGVFFNRDLPGYAPPVTVTGCTITGWAVRHPVRRRARRRQSYSGTAITNNSDQREPRRRDQRLLPSSGYSHENVVHHRQLGVYNQTGYSGNTATSSGHGIVVGNASGGTIAQNVTYGNGASCGCTSAGPVGNWAYSSPEPGHREQRLLWQPDTLPRVTRTVTRFDLDDQCVNCTLQYNIAYENDGFGIACYSDDSTWTGNVIQYNLTWGNSVTNPDAGEFSFLGGAFANCDVYGNTFIGQVNAELPSVVVLFGASFTSVNLWNNIFYTAASGVSLMFADTAYTGITFQGNLYYSAAPFSISWGGTGYSSLAAWRTATGQEKAVQAASTWACESGPIATWPHRKPRQLSRARTIRLMYQAMRPTTGGARFPGHQRWPEPAVPVQRQPRHPGLLRRRPVGAAVDRRVPGRASWPSAPRPHCSPDRRGRRRFQPWRRAARLQQREVRPPVPAPVTITVGDVQRPPQPGTWYLRTRRSSVPHGSAATSRGTRGPGARPYRRRLRHPWSRKRPGPAPRRASPAHRVKVRGHPRQLRHHRPVRVQRRHDQRHHPRRRRRHLFSRRHPRRQQHQQQRAGLVLHPCPACPAPRSSSPRHRPPASSRTRTR